jgi:hypothetical protein
VLLPVVAASRLFDRVTARDYDPPRELRSRHRPNGVFERVQAIEAAAIKRGVSLPFGVSRLIVARRP